MRLPGSSRFLSLIAIIAAAPAMAGTAPGAPDALDACVMEAATKLNFNGVLYARLGGRTLHRSFGTLDKLHHVPISDETEFNIASAGKMFTAVAIGRLVDSGMLAFDAPISRYLDGLSPEIGAITIAQLLNHTSGLGDFFDPRNAAAIEAARTATDLLPLALQSPLEFAPGTRRAYSNSGFVVLGAIIEKVSGQSYASFVRNEILQPMHMSHTEFDARDSAIPLSRMSPEGPRKDLQPVPPVFLHSSPAGGIYSTAGDLSVFLDGLSKGQLVRPRTLSALLTPRADPSGTGALYGFGFTTRAGVPRRVGHGGGAPGMNAEVAFYPDSGQMLIALSNNDPPAATRMVAVLDQAVSATDPAAACERALADPQVGSQVLLPPPR